MAKNHMAGGRPTSGSSSSAPNKSRNRWTAVVCSPLHCMCAADWTDGSRWRQLAAAASVPRRPEPSRAARPLSIRLPVIDGDLPKQWPAKTRPQIPPPRLTGHTAAQNARFSRSRPHRRRLQKRHASRRVSADCWSAALPLPRSSRPGMRRLQTKLFRRHWDFCFWLYFVALILRLCLRHAVLCLG